MKMLFFDYRESEKKYFEKNKYPDYDITFYETSLNESTHLTSEEFENTTIVSVFITSQITEHLINKFKNLTIITTRSTGYDHIDIEACADRHIAVLNVEDYGREPVIQYTLGVLIALTRNILPAIKCLKNVDVEYEQLLGQDLSSLSIGVIGTGSIGAAICRMMHNFGMTIYAYDFRVRPDLVDFVEYVELDDLYRKSDVITLHIPYTDESYHMISDEEFTKMKDGVYIINTSRGELIDTVAIYKAIKDGKVRGAALDVLECESLNLSKDNLLSMVQEASCECLSSTVINLRLIREPNVIITPHIAYNSQSAIDTILYKTFCNIHDYHKGLKKGLII